MITIEILVCVLGMGVLLADLWIRPESRPALGWLTAALVGCLLVFSVGDVAPGDGVGFGGMYVIDAMARYFKAFFLLGAMIVILMAVEYSNRIPVGLSEFIALTLFAVAGMLFAASANDLFMLFVSLELVTVTFYVLNSFQRNRLMSLEAGVKYLIMGALSSAFLVFGIALMSGSAGTANFAELNARQLELAKNPLFLAGLLLVMAGLGFKIAAFPFQIWAPDVYQGSPTPATALLACGSKATGFVLLLRLMLGVVPVITVEWHRIWLLTGVVTILYGSLCAIPQRSVKRIMGYSSIANAGFLVLGMATVSSLGSAAVMYYLGGYFFTVLGAFTVLSVILSDSDNDDIAAFASMGQRSPFLAAALTIAMASLAGIPPMVGFFGKFLIFRSVAELGFKDPAYVWALAAAVVGAVVSLYYYFGVIRSMYWGVNPVNLTPIRTSLPAKLAVGICVAGMLYNGIAPNGLLEQAGNAAAVFKLSPVTPMHAGK